MVLALGTGHCQSECDGLTYIYCDLWEGISVFHLVGLLYDFRQVSPWQLLWFGLILISPNFHQVQDSVLASHWFGSESPSRWENTPSSEGFTIDPPFLCSDTPPNTDTHGAKVCGTDTGCLFWLGDRLLEKSFSLGGYLGRADLSFNYERNAAI